MSSWWKLAAFVFVVLAAMLWWYFDDEAPGDYSDLEPVDYSTPEGVAAFENWVRIGYAIDQRHAFWQYASNYRRGKKPWNESVVRAFLNSERSNLAQIDAYAGCPPMTVPGEKAYDAYDIGYVIKILWARALHSLNKGDEDGAVTDALLMLRLCDEMSFSREGLNGILYGSMYSRWAYGAIGVIIDSTDDPGTLTALQKALDESMPIGQLVPDALRGEFGSIVTAVEENDLERWVYIHRAFEEMTFRPNQTLNKIAATYRVAIKNAGLPMSKRRVLPLPGPMEEEWRTRKNYLGDLLTRVVSPEGMLYHADYSLAWRRLLRARLAILRFQMTRRNSPEKLADLVPEFIDAVPTDPFAGQPIRYDPVRGLLWVTGRDLIDGGGQAVDPKVRFVSMKDPGIDVLSKGPSNQR